MLNLGMISLRSNHNKSGYLQAESSGNMHAGNPFRNEEETWFLWEVDKAAHQYALMNWKSGTFLSRVQGGSTTHKVMGNAGGVGSREIWLMFKGEPYAHPGSVAFRLADPHEPAWLCAHEAGTDATGEPGEVYVEWSDPPHGHDHPSDAGFEGWFFLNGVDAPKPGNNAWNTVGQWFHGVLNNIKPADIAALVAAL